MLCMTDDEQNCPLFGETSDRKAIARDIRQTVRWRKLSCEACLCRQFWGILFCCRTTSDWNCFGIYFSLHLNSLTNCLNCFVEQLPKFQHLCQDSIWGVRKCCADVFVPLAITVSTKLRKEVLSPLFVNLLNDQSRWVCLQLWCHSFSKINWLLMLKSGKKWCLSNVGTIYIDVCRPE